jgi:hypothetical protein
MPAPLATIIGARAKLACALCALALLALPAAAWAQDKPFAPGGPTVSLAATGTTGSVQVQASASSTAMRVYNSGSVAVFLACGVSGVVATVAAGMPIAPGTVEVIGCNQTYVAGITGGTAATVYVLFWVGVPLLSLLLGPVWRLINPIWEQEPFEEREPLDELIARIDPRRHVGQAA